jgi:hypothetical protein
MASISQTFAFILLFTITSALIIEQLNGSIVLYNGSNVASPSASPSLLVGPDELDWTELRLWHLVVAIVLWVLYRVTKHLYPHIHRCMQAHRLQRHRHSLSYDQEMAEIPAATDLSPAAPDAMGEMDIADA